jgi:hypothetical protein
MNPRLQKPNSMSTWEKLRPFVRRIVNKYKPYVVANVESSTSNEEDGTHYKIVIGKNIKVHGFMWFSNGMFRANFDLPMRASKAEPSVETDEEKKRILVFKKKDSDTGEEQDNGNEIRKVRFFTPDRSIYESDVAGIISKILKAINAISKEEGEDKEDIEIEEDDEKNHKNESFDIVSVPRQFIEQMDSGMKKECIVESVDAYGDGRGTYLATKINTIGEKQIIEVLGPFSSSGKLCIPKKFDILHKIEEAASRKEAIEKARYHFLQNVGPVEESFGTLALFPENYSATISVKKIVVSPGEIIVSAKDEQEASAKALKKRKSIKYKDAVSTEYEVNSSEEYEDDEVIDDEDIVEESKGEKFKWRVDVNKIDTYKLEIEGASNKKEAIKLAKKISEEKAMKKKTTYDIGSIEMIG